MAASYNGFWFMQGPLPSHLGYSVEDLPAYAESHIIARGVQMGAGTIKPMP